MLRKLLFPLILGLAGCGTLIGLGLWQVDRLAWKEEIIAGIDNRLASPAAELSIFVNENQDEYRPISMIGTPTGEELHVLVSGTQAGTGYRVISKFETEIGPILLDQGLLPIADKDAKPLVARMNVTGTLLWPDDQNDSTPEPDLDANIWFARNIDTMSEVLDTRPLLVVATRVTPADPRLTPLPVSTATIKNDHFEYAVTWFLLAIVWAIMSLYLMFRITRQKDAED